MHALMISVTFTDRDAALGEELDALVKFTCSQPGFISGHWIAMPDNTGEAMIVFGKAEDAEAFAAEIAHMPPSSAAINSVRIGEVAESVQSRS
jgi:hypothetical protein